MAIKISYGLDTPPDDGSINWHPIMKAFQEIQEILNEHADELKASVKHNTQSISFAIEGAGIQTILKGSKHQRGRITNAYVIMGDNVSSATIIEILGITQPINFSETEGSGKVRIFKLKKSHLHFIDEVKVNQTGDRRMVINLTIESTEED